MGTACCRRSFSTTSAIRTTLNPRAVRAAQDPGKDSSVYAVMVALTVKEDQVGKFIEEAMLDAKGSVANEPGCRRFDIVQDAKNPHRFAFCEVYDDKKAFEYHTTTPHFLRFKENVPPLLKNQEKVSFCKNVYPATKDARWSSKGDGKAVDHTHFSKGSLHVIHAPHYVKPEKADDFIKAIVADAEDSVEQEPGCMRFDVFQNIEHPEEIYLYEVYVNADAFDYHCGTPHIATWKDAVKDMYLDEREGMPIQDYQNFTLRIGRNVWPPDNGGWSVY